MTKTATLCSLSKAETDTKTAVHFSK